MAESPVAGVLPLTLAATALPGGWQDSIAWPVSLDDRRARTVGLIGRALDWLHGIADANAQRAAILASADFLTVTGRVIDRAHVLAGVRGSGQDIAGGDAESAYLWRGGDLPDAKPRRPAIPGGTLRRLRGLRHARRWTPAWRLPATALAPHATVLSLNDLLVDCARRASLRLDYTDPRLLLPAAAATAAVPDDADRDLATRWVDDAFAGSNLPEPFATRARALVANHAERGIAAARALFEALRHQRLPQHLWAGTGGNMTTRALGLETMQRGGSVTRFNHGGSVGMTDYADKLAFLEFTASTRYVAPTAAIADILRTDAARRAWAEPDAIDHGHGDPLFARIAARTPRTRPARPTVAYVTCLFPVNQIHFPPVPPDPVYFAWQLRLIATMQRLPVDLVCRPHPENLILFDRQPLEGHATLSNAPFGAVVDASDVMLFDWAQTTSFWETLCSDRPVVLVDVNRTAFHPAVRAVIKRRCHIVPTRSDDRNLPTVDHDELAAAICDAPARADPDEIRSLLAGQP